MQLNRRTVVQTVAVMMLMAACGGAASTNRSSVTPTARQVLLTSVHRTTSQSFLADMSIDETMTVTGPQAHQLHALAAQPTIVSIQMSAESQQRMRLAMTATVAGRRFNVVTVLYDGTVFQSTDGGTTFTANHSVGLAPTQFSSANALAYIQSVAAVTDEGPGTADGVAVERYFAQLDPVKVVAIIKSALSFVQSPQVERLFNSLTFKAGAMQVTVDHQGRVVTATGAVDASIDLGAISTSYAGTHVAIHEIVDAHFRDYGTPITVTKPAVTAD